MRINKIIAGMLFTLLIIYPSIIIGYEYVTNDDDICEVYVLTEKATIPVEIGEGAELVDIKPQVNTPKLTQDEVDLISRVVMAEAEDEPLEGKIYVIDTILNRVDSERFPNTVYDVIYQPSQFTSMWNGRYDRCESNQELNNLINNEYVNRKNSDIVFFTADQYGQYGEPSFSVANHYFSIYN